MKNSFMAKLISGIISICTFDHPLLAQQIEIETKIGRNYLLSDANNNTSMTHNMGLHFFAGRRLFFTTQYTSGSLRGTVNNGTFFQNNYHMYDAGIGLNIDSIFKKSSILARTGYRILCGFGQINNEVTTLEHLYAQPIRFSQPSFTYYIQGCLYYTISPEISLQTAVKLNLTQSNILDGVAGNRNDHIISIGIGLTYRFNQQTQIKNVRTTALSVPADSSMAALHKRFDKVDSILHEINLTPAKPLPPADIKADTSENNTTIHFPTSRYYIILGGYQKILPATAEMDRLIKNGTAARLISKSGKSDLVLISCFETNNLREALIMMKFFRGKINKEAWIYVNLNHNQL